MRYKINEQRKHQLVGLALLVSIAVVLLPPMFNQPPDNLDKTAKLALHLPSKPLQPVVAIPDQKEMFQTIKVAHVDLAEVTESSQIAHRNAKAVSISRASNEKPSHLIAKADVLQKNVQAIRPEKQLKKPVVITKEMQYAVQLASFTVEKNAELLVNRLKQKGYQASYNEFTNKKGKFYKVIVGQLNKKEKAHELQKKLAESLNLNGLVIKTGVS